MPDRNIDEFAAAESSESTVDYKNYRKLETLGSVRVVHANEARISSHGDP